VVRNEGNKPLIRSRPGWSSISAIRNGQVYEVKSTYILQPGPASLTEGSAANPPILARVVGVDVAPSLKPKEKIDPQLL